jgi:rsbT co-antagonist protein RsbR
MHGYTEEEVQDQSLAMFHTEEQFLKDVAPSIKAVVETGTYLGEIGHVKKDGTTFPTMMTVNMLLDDDGSPLGMLGTARDITEAKAAEAQVRQLARAVEQATDGIAIADMEGNLEFVNTAWAAMHGYTQDELTGKHIFAFLSEQALQQVQPEYEQREQETEAFQAEQEHVRKDGSLFPTMVTSTILRDEEGAPAGMLGTARDITTLKEAEAERERLQQEIIEAQQRAIQELSTPVIPVMDRIIVMPLVGSIDTMRAKDIMRTLLRGIREHKAKIVILDITGVPIMDSGVANHLNKTIQAARLKGAHTIVTGVSDAVAETIIDLGIDWNQVETLGELQTGLLYALNRLGIALTKA